MGNGQSITVKRESAGTNPLKAIGNAVMCSAGGVIAGSAIGWGEYWKRGKQYDEKSAKVSDMILHVPDHDTFMSAMLCRLMYTFDGRLLKIKGTILAYRSLEDLRDATSSTSNLAIQLNPGDQSPVVLGAGDVDMGELEVNAACTKLTAPAKKESSQLRVLDMQGWQKGDFLMIYYPSTGGLWDYMMNKSEKVRIQTVDKEAHVIRLESALKSDHNAEVKVYKIRKYVEIMHQQSRMYIEFEAGKFEMVSGNKVDILGFIKTELSGGNGLRRKWFHRAMFHPGGALSPSFCSVIAADGHEGARYARISDTASTRVGESCTILCHDEADSHRAYKVMFEDGDIGWFQETEILDKKEPGPAPVTMWIAWQGSMFDKRPIDAFTDLGGAPVKAELWYKQFPDLWVHSAMYSKIQNDAIGQKDIILQLIQAYDVKRIVFCGHSLGGGLARIAHVYTLAAFGEMMPEEKHIVQDVDVRSITWASPMVLFEQEIPETGRRLIPLTIKDNTGQVVKKMVPMFLDDFRWKLESEALLRKRKPCEDMPAQLPISEDIPQQALAEWESGKYEKSNEAEKRLDTLKTALLEKSVNHIFDKDIIPQLPANHQFFQPAIAMAARSAVMQHCPCWEESLTNVVNDLVSLAFPDGALNDNFKELERYSHLCVVKVYDPTSEAPKLVECTKDLAPWEHDADDSYQYLLTCHRMLPNNVQGSSTLTRSTKANDMVIHVASTHDWRINDCLRILSKTAEEELQIGAFQKAQITLKKPLKHDYAVEVVVRREPRRIVDKSGNLGTYNGSLVCGRASGEGSMHYDKDCDDKRIADKLFVGKFDKDHPSVGLILDGDTPTFTVKDGQLTDQLDPVIAKKYAEMSATAKAVQNEQMRQEDERKELNSLSAMTNENVQKEALKKNITEEDISDARFAAWKQDRDPKLAVIELILRRKATTTKTIANSSAYP